MADILLTTFYERPHRWIPITEGTPELDFDEYYGNTYSVAVICMIDGKRWDPLMRYNYRMRGWVHADLHAGPDPDDYPEIQKPTHFHYMPEPLRL